MNKEHTIYVVNPVLFGNERGEVEIEWKRKLCI